MSSRASSRADTKPTEHASSTPSGEQSSAGDTKTRTRKTKAEKEVEALATLEEADAKVKEAAMGEAVQPLLEETTARALQLAKDSKTYYLGRAMVQIHGADCVDPTGGRYINRRIDEQHVENLAATMHDMGILDETNPILFAVPDQSVDLEKLRRDNNPLQSLITVKINVPNEFIFMIAGHHRYRATARLILVCSANITRLTAERRVTQEAAVGAEGHRPLNVIDAEIELEMMKRTRAHFYAVDMYSLGKMWATFMHDPSANNVSHSRAACSPRTACA